MSNLRRYLGAEWNVVVVGGRNLRKKNAKYRREEERSLIDPSQTRKGVKSRVRIAHSKVSFHQSQI
jgi:hypothetical protein